MTVNEWRSPLQQASGSVGRRVGHHRFLCSTGRLTIVILMAMAMPLSSDAQQERIRSSILLLVDTSGSMDDQIGNGNAEIKIEAAKDAAITAIDRALANNTTEVAVMGFSGGCQNPISEYVDFTTDVHRLTEFIRRLQPGGGTPMADAVLAANRFMADKGTPGTRSQMIVLLADGDNDCGDVADAMAELRDAGIVFRHETVGFGIEPASSAAHDLRHVANASGGQYFHAASAIQLADVFMEFVDTFTVIDMLGMFGGTGNEKAAPGSQVPPPGSAPPPTPEPTPGAAQEDGGGVAGMIGMFQAADEQADSFGALAIDAHQGTAWGWATGHANEAEAERAAVEECGAGCWVVGTFQDGCAAFAADQTSGRTIWYWAAGEDTAFEASRAALDGCNRRGGLDCLVRVWACSPGTGGGAEGRGQQDGLASGDMDGASDGKMVYGAIAIATDDSAAWGWASGYPTEEEAKQTALDECGQNCRIEVTFDVGCAALAQDETVGSTATGWSAGYETRDEAEHLALEECAEVGGTNCAVQVWDCS